MSALDDLLDLSGPTTGQSSGQAPDPFDPLSDLGSSGNKGGGESLLDFGFEASVSVSFKTIKASFVGCEFCDYIINKYVIHSRYL